MPSFEDRINDLTRQLTAAASAVKAQQGDRVFNFHYRPSEWTTFQQQLPRLTQRLRERDFAPHTVSFSDIILSIFEASPIYGALKKMESKAQFSHQQRNESLHRILVGDGSSNPELSLASPIVQAIEAAIADAAAQPNGILILTDANVLHPLFRVSSLEQILQGRFQVPTVICYPGEKGGIGDNPSFLGIYPADGNYRSSHIY